MKHSTKLEEQRHYTRVPFDGWARLSNADTSWEGRLIDISLRGVLLLNLGDEDRLNRELSSMG